MPSEKLTQKDIADGFANYPAKKSLWDGAGLSLVFRSPTSASWVYSYKVHGVGKRMGLGSYPAVSLKQARKLALQARGQKATGDDPLRVRAAIRRRGVTFEDAARDYWRTHCQDLAKPKNWLGGMEKNVFPHIGRKPVADLLPEDFIKFMKPIWHREKTRKLRQWINAVVGFVSVDDPRIDRDLLKKVDNKLGPQSIEYENHAAIAWQDIPRLWVALPATLVGLSMKLLILSGVRVNCAVLAEWSEIDHDEAVWTIPAGRVKGWKYAYRVPLTASMTEVLRVARQLWGGEGLIFPSPDSASGHLSNNAHRLWLHEHKWKDPNGELATAHGLRSALRTWMDDQKPKMDWRLSEHVLQHMGRLGTATEQAYLRSDQLDHRREVLERWDAFVTSGARGVAEKAKAREKAMAMLDEPAEAPAPNHPLFDEPPAVRTLREVLEWSAPTKDDLAEATEEREAEAKRAEAEKQSAAKNR